MKRVLTAVILIPLVVLALFKAPLWLFTLLVLGVALLAAKEYLDIAQATGFRPFRGLSYFFLVCVFGSLCAPVAKFGLDAFRTYGVLTTIIGAVALPLLLGSPLILMSASLRRETLSQSLPDAGISFLVIPYVGLTLAALVFLRESESGAFFLLCLLLIVWAGDIAALYVGRAIGRHRLAPRISPGKTWEGTIASSVGAVIVALLLSHYSGAIQALLARVNLLRQEPHLYARVAGSDIKARSSQLMFVIVLIFAVCVNISAQLGDLFESAIKRGAGLKDSGNLLPGHGGVLDRIDALLFALPVGLFFYTIMH